MSTYYVSCFIQTDGCRHQIYGDNSQRCMSRPLPLTPDSQNQLSPWYHQSERNGHVKLNMINTELLISLLRVRPSSGVFCLCEGHHHLFDYCFSPKLWSNPWFLSLTPLLTPSASHLNILCIRHSSVSCQSLPVISKPPPHYAWIIAIASKWSPCFHSYLSWSTFHPTASVPLKIKNKKSRQNSVTFKGFPVTL